MDFGSIERQLHIAATPEIVYEVVSRPEHLREWWPDEADLDPHVGATGTITFGVDKVENITVVEADPPRRFAFRWVHEADVEAALENSLLVTFELAPAAGGTLLRFTETGFRERGWDEAKVAAEYADHESGWAFYLPRLPLYAAKVAQAA